MLPALSSRSYLRTTLLLAATLLLPACDLGPSNIEIGAATQVLHLGNGTEPRDLDPHTVTGVTEHNIMSALFEGLVAEDPQSLEPLPGTASHWQVSDDGRIYRFTLRENARWSNGEAVTASDFAWSWQRLLSPGLASEYAYQLFVIKNARAFNSGEIDDFKQVGIRVVDPRTLEVELDHRTPYFLSLLAHFSSYPVHPETILAHGDMDQRGSRWTRAGNLVGNGPFSLEEWRLNHLIRVKKNSHYWDSKRVRLNEIRFYPIDNVQTEERMFRTGVLHVAGGVPIDKLDDYRTQQPERLHISPYLGTYYFRLNTTRGPMTDRRVRKALSLAIDRKMIVEAITRGGQIPAQRFTPPGLRGYSDQPAHASTATESYEEAVQQARKLLAAAGHPDGEDFPTLDLLYNTSDGHRRVAVAIQQMWKEALNIDIRLSNQDWKVFLSRVRSLDYDIARAGWIGDYPDPATFLDMFKSNAGNNQTGWSNARYDTLLERAAATADPASRMQIMRQAENILLDDAPIAPIYYYTRTELRHPQVKGWWPNLLDHHPYKYVYLADEKPATNAGGKNR